MAVFTQSDAVIYDTVVKNSTLWSNLSPSSAQARYNEIIKPNVELYFKNLVKTDKYLADHPEIVEAQMRQIEEACLKLMTRKAEAESEGNAKKND